MNCVWGVEDAEGIHSKKEVNHGGVARDYHGERGVACIQLIHAFTNGFHRSPPHFFQLFLIIFTVKNPGQNICPPLDLLIEALSPDGEKAVSGVKRRADSRFAQKDVREGML